MILIICMASACYAEAQLPKDAYIDSLCRIVMVVESNEQLSVKQAKTNVKEAIMRSFTNGTSVIQNETDNTIYLSGSANCGTFTILLESFDAGSFHFNAKIICKPGRSKVIVYDIIHKGGRIPPSRDGSIFCDDTPSTWRRYYKKKTRKEWDAMKERALYTIGTMMTNMVVSLNQTEDDAKF